MSFQLVVGVPYFFSFPPKPRKQLTTELSLAGNFGQQLCEVWEVIGEELGTEDDVFARVCRRDLAAQQLNLPSDAQSRTLECSLLVNAISTGRHRLGDGVEDGSLRDVP